MFGRTDKKFSFGKGHFEKRMVDIYCPNPILTKYRRKDKFIISIHTFQQEVYCIPDIVDRSPCTELYWRVWVPHGLIHQEQ